MTLGSNTGISTKIISWRNRRNKLVSLDNFCRNVVSVLVGVGEGVCVGGCSFVTSLLSVRISLPKHGVGESLQIFSFGNGEDFQYRGESGGGGGGGDRFINFL